MKYNENVYNKLLMMLNNKIKLKIKLANNLLKKTHLIKKNNKNIARIKMMISYKKKNNNKK
ncbi:50S ribosomal protein L29 [endosymbiont of Euscepes postfasciatus]|uniref:50S ribosomal protein L29 n=1 Tax=endosymbiont of Euscepes postfasciatus TaxID=650377 RepID=UPI00102F1459|nr:50S ribosomal protein L29 [endosymbiont of Euscepes postfasciatus]